MAKANTYMTFGLLILAVIAAALAAPLFGYGAQKQQAVPSGTPPAGTETSAGADTFAPSEVDTYLYDARYPSNAITDTSVTATVYPKGTSNADMASTLTQTVDSIATTAAGKLAFVKGKMYTGATYTVKFFDDATTPAYYSESKDVSVLTRNPALGTGAIGTNPQSVSLSAIGTITDPMTANATSAVGGALAAGITSSDATNTITINKSAITTATVSFRIPLTFANSAAGTYLKNMALDPYTGNTMSTTAFSTAQLTPNGGTVLVPAQSILGSVQSSAPISLGTWDDNTGSAPYYLTLGIANASIVSGDTYYFYVDDLNGHFGKDPLTNKVGATGANVSIAVTQ